ncbi:hypothetical protein TanjilG_03061 [Lupinus angustifolius]|uniref:Uncharacterized protein n=1 Tax=Lupinus angustifolius TaxID=3871 RepID=A0A4P1RDI6_LUPAN|nr:hypothetical protein TanjilG_03061 [Lupinus angustifolius]
MGGALMGLAMLGIMVVFGEESLNSILNAFKFQMQVDEDEIYWRHRKEDEELECSHNFTHLISQLVQCFINAMVVSRSWIGGIFSCTNTRRSSSEKFVNYPLRPVEASSLVHFWVLLKAHFAI